LKEFDFENIPKSTKTKNTEIKGERKKSINNSVEVRTKTNNFFQKSDQKTDTDTTKDLKTERIDSTSNSKVNSNVSTSSKWKMNSIAKV